MRKHPVAATAAIALVLAAGPATAAHSQADDPLATTIDAILTDPILAGAQAAVVVHDAATGEELYERDGDTRMLPASNTKLLTSAAAMEILGPSYRFATDVLADRDPRGSVLRGDLYLRGTGDPTMLAEDYDALAGKVAASGIEVVTGDLVADDTWFDEVRLGTSWAWDDEPFYYSAQVSALSVAPDTDYDAGTIIVGVTPGAAPGEPVTVRLTPPSDYVSVVNRAVTAEPGAESAVQIERGHGSAGIVVSGQLPLDGSPVREWASVWEPTGYAADVFRAALDRHGVTVLGGSRLGEPTPAGATELATHESMTLAELLVPFLKLSNNGHAEVLTKAIGRAVSGAGTWSAGLAAIGSYLDSQGLDVDTVRQADGSGLSRWNLVPANEFVGLLDSLQDASWFETWYQALPVAGNPQRFVGGTLRSRMQGTAAQDNAHAKTGSLTSVSALSGYVTDADGRDLIFSIVLNNFYGSIKYLEDLIVVALAEFSADAPPGEAGIDRMPQRPALPDDVECSWVKPAMC
jgi:serine-type D-Ala-D-Ala carboxypeptidase/endopeptidase (penicillin-binding protein 4)